MFPFSGLRLLLPAIIPSWRFFDAVTASPRVEYAVLAGPDDASWEWREFRPRRAVLSFGMMLRRLLWNPQWNENLFLVSLAERLMSNSATPQTAAHSERELLLRVARHLDREGVAQRGDWLQIRLRFVGRAGPTEEVSGDVVYQSSPYPIAELITP